MNTSFERLDGNAVKLTVTCSAEEVDKAVEAAYVSVSAKMRIPGFRKGKAPRPVIDNYVGKEYVLSTATEELVSDCYPRALDQADMRPIDQPKIELTESVVPGEEFVFDAEVDVRPQLTIGALDDIKVTVPSKECTPAELDAQIDQVRERFATLEPVEDRGVGADDFVLLSFVGTVDGEEYEGNAVDKYMYEMGRGLMPVEFDEGIMGLKPEDTAHVEFVIPDTTSNPEFVGKTAGFDITVHEIKAKNLPEVDDEFASNMGGFDSVDQMREDLKRRIDMQKALGWAQAQERAIRAALLERLEGDVPEIMVDDQAGRIGRDFMQGLDERGITLKDYLDSINISLETYEKDIRQQAEQSVREDLALEAVFRKLEMEITDEDVDQELADVSQAIGASPEEARKRWEELGLMSVIREQVMRRKAMAWLTENVESVEEGGEPAAEVKPKKASKPRAKKKAEEAPAEAAESEE